MLASLLQQLDQAPEPIDSVSVAWSGVAPFLALLVGAVVILIVGSLTRRTPRNGTYATATILTAVIAIGLNVPLWERVQDAERGPCDELAPKLEELHRQRPDVQVLVISRRDPEATRAKAESLGLTYPIVMQKQWELSLKYAMFATPVGYLIDENGVLVHDVAVGVEPILALAQVRLGRPHPTPLTALEREPILAN